jgi:hypothetical protein
MRPDPNEKQDDGIRAMTILISAFGFAGRFAGDLLMSALGWASSLLFGRVPRTHQVFLVLMMAMSFLWIVAVVALLVPTVASTLLATTPHPPFVDNQWFGLAVLLSVILLPLCVGAAGYLVPAEGERPDGVIVLREVLRGYLLAPVISGLLIFLAGVGIARKVRSRRRGWSDAHVAIVVKPDGYDQLVTDVQKALESADLQVTATDAPWVLTLPARILTRVSGSSVRKLRPDRLVALTAPDLNVGVYPSDIAISGPTPIRTRARAAIVSRLATASAHLTTSKEAQEVEDRLGKLARQGGAAGATSGAGAKSAARTPAGFEAIDATLLDLAVPTDEWDILYRIRLQIERDLRIGAEPGTAFPGREPNSREVKASRGSTRQPSVHEKERERADRADPVAKRSVA